MARHFLLLAPEWFKGTVLVIRCLLSLVQGRVEARLAARPPHRTGLALLRHPALHNSIYR